MRICLWVALHLFLYQINCSYKKLMQHFLLIHVDAVYVNMHNFNFEKGHECLKKQLWVKIKTHILEKRTIKFRLEEVIIVIATRPESMALRNLLDFISQFRVLFK